MDWMKKTALYSLLVLLLVSAFSCRTAEEEEVTGESMSGAIDFDVPYYVHKGQTVTMRASGITYPRDAYYKWYVSGVYADTLTSNVITVRFPDSLGVFNVSAVSFAPGFYSNSSTRTVTTVDTSYNGSVKGLSRSGFSIVDARDGMVYDYVTIGDFDWFSQNLAYVDRTEAVYYKQSPAVASLFGAFYTFYEAARLKICPEGWYVPGNAEWENLAASVNGGVALPFIDNWAGLGSKLSADASFNGSRLWPYSPDNTHTNDFGWNALPLGSMTSDGSQVAGERSYGYWWSASESADGYAYYRYIYYDEGSFPMGSVRAGGSDGYVSGVRMSVRCVRKHQQSW